MFYEIENDISKDDTVNSKNKQGKKVCPITFITLNTNNSIKIENVYYSIKGFAEWVRTELKNDDNTYIRESLDEFTYEDDPTESVSIQKMSKDEFVFFFEIRSPLTNQPYSEEVKKQIYDMFITSCFERTDVSLFIDKNNNSQIDDDNETDTNEDENENEDENDNDNDRMEIGL